MLIVIKVSTLNQTSYTLVGHKKHMLALCHPELLLNLVEFKELFTNPLQLCKRHLTGKEVAAGKKLVSTRAR
jgi:hypothetical protein